MNTDTKLGPADLVRVSAVERVRRQMAARDLTAGAWAHVTDTSLVAEIGESIVRIVAGTGREDRTVRPLINGQGDRRVPMTKLLPCFALGDSISTVEGDGTVVMYTSHCTQGYAFHKWRSDDRPEHVEIEVHRGKTPTSSKSLDVISSHSVESPNLTGKGGVLVRGRLAASDARADGPAGVGPYLPEEVFLSLVGNLEPARPRLRAGQPIVDKLPQGTAVLCDFVGGATLWIWESCLRTNPHQIFWEDSPSEKHHPETDQIAMPSVRLQASPDVTATRDASPRDPLQAAIEARNSQQALPESTMTDPTLSPLLLRIINTPPPNRGDVVIVDEEYDHHRDEVVSGIHSAWSDEEELEDIDNDLQSVGCESDCAGAYMVRSVREVELPNGMTFCVVRCRDVQCPNGDSYNFIAGLLRVVGGALARADETAGGVKDVAKRAVKGATNRALGMGREAVGAARDLVKEEVTRKGVALAKIAGEGTIVGSHEVARRTVGAAIGAALGKDPATFAESAIFKTGFDTAAKGGMRFAAKVMEKFSPATAKMIGAAADTLEDGIDRRQAQGLIDQAAPLIGGGIKALAQAGVAKFMPALAAASPAPALPPAPEDVPPAPAKRSRKPKSEPASQQADAPAEQPAKRSRKPKGGAA